MRALARIYLQSCNVTLRSVRDEHLRLLYPHVWVHFVSYNLAQVLQIFSKQIRSWFSEPKHELASGSCSRINYTLEFKCRGFFALPFDLAPVRNPDILLEWITQKGRTQCRRLLALCGVWGRVVFKPQALPTQMYRGWGSNPGPSGYRR